MNVAGLVRHGGARRGGAGLGPVGQARSGVAWQRPQRSGEYGTFQVDTDKGVEVI